MMLILSKRAPSPHWLVYGTSLPVLSKTVQSKLQQRPSREAGLLETFRKTTSINEDLGDNENDDEDMEIDFEDEDDSDLEYDIVDPWEDLCAKVKESLNSRFGKQVERLQEKGASEAIAEAKACNALLPVFRGKLRRLYLHYLKWFRRLKRDPVHEEVLKTLRRFMDEEEGMDYEEAADTAVDRRKFLLNRIFQRKV